MHLISWTLQSGSEQLVQQFIVKSHASTAYLEERKIKFIFRKKKVQSHIKRKIVVTLEQGMDDDNMTMMKMRMMKKMMTPETMIKTMMTLKDTIKPAADGEQTGRLQILKSCPRSREADKLSIGDSGREEKNFWARPRPSVPEA